MIAQELEVSLHMAFMDARQKRHELITVEHLLLAMLDNPSASEVLNSCGANLDKLREDVVGHIEEHTPKFIVEYGGGQSTFMLTEFVNYLNYGGKVVGYECNSYWYNDHIENGWNKHNNIKLVDAVEDIYRPVVEEHHYGKVTGVRYIHPIEDIEGVDFVILDGPALKDFKSEPSTTFNLMDIVNHLGYTIPYFIDGRSGTRNFYGNNTKIANK